MPVRRAAQTPERGPVAGQGQRVARVDAASGRSVDDYAAWARGCGGFGVHVDKPGELPDALHQALAFDGPALVDVAVDPNEPPMPGKVEYQQAKKFAQAFLRGQPHKAAIATTLFKDRIEQLKA